MFGLYVITKRITWSIHNPKKEVTSFKHDDEKLLTEIIHKTFATGDKLGKCIEIDKAFRLVKLNENSRLKYASDISLSSSASSAQLEARIRCRNPRFPVTPNNPKEYSYYFCIEFEGISDEDSEKSFLGSEISFAEVTLEMRNFKTKQGVSCEDFQKQQFKWV